MLVNIDILYLDTHKDRQEEGGRTPVRNSTMEESGRKPLV